MYPILLLAVGRPKLEGVRLLEAHYRELLKGYARLEVLEVPEGRGEEARRLREEAERLRPRLLAARCPVLSSAPVPKGIVAIRLL